MLKEKTVIFISNHGIYRWTDLLSNFEAWDAKGFPEIQTWDLQIQTLKFYTPIDQGGFEYLNILLKTLSASLKLLMFFLNVVWRLLHFGWKLKFKRSPNTEVNPFELWVKIQDQSLKTYSA